MTRPTLIDRDRASVWHPYTQMLTAPPPLPIVRGEGAYLYYVFDSWTPDA